MNALFEYRNSLDNLRFTPEEKAALAEADLRPGGLRPDTGAGGNGRQLAGGGGDRAHFGRAHRHRSHSAGPRAGKAERLTGRRRL